MIHITDAIAIEEREVDESFIRASGPGGQNVNKVATAVQLRFDVRRSPSLPDAVRARLEKLAGRRLTQEGVLIISLEAKSRRAGIKKLRTTLPLRRVGRETRRAC